MTKLAAAILVHSIDQALEAAGRAASLGADLVEYRIDLFADDPGAVEDLIGCSPLPCIITCRPTWEGGQYDGDDRDRISMLEASVLGEHQPTYLDIELAAFQRSFNLRQKVGLMVDHPAQVRPVETGLILSSHDFEQRPMDLLQRVEAMAASTTCRVIKIVWMAKSLRDNLEAFEILQGQYKPTIALCMGEAGLPSRVLAKKFGAMLSFAAIDGDEATAPGQPTLTQMKKLYRWDAINAQTKVYGVIGHPVAHSASPAIHNGGFDATDFDGVYLPMPIAPSYEAFKATVGAWLDMTDLHFRGASVTIPHKQNLIQFVREQGGEVEELAQKIGAANTLTVRDDGSLFASNTDYAGALDAVVESLGIERHELADFRVAVIGAGGAARSIVAGFAHYGATVTVYNRTREKAQLLADELGCGDGKIIAASLETLCESVSQVFINCTPLGMHPHVDQSPIEPTHFGKNWGPGTVVFDTVYNPRFTKLIKDAREAGCVTIDGTQMFIRQAAAQFELWTGTDAPLAEFEKILLSELG